MQAYKVISYSYPKQIFCSNIVFLLLILPIYLMLKYFIIEIESAYEYLDTIFILVLISPFLTIFMDYLFDKFMGHNELIKFYDDFFNHIYRESHFEVKEKDYFYKNITNVTVKRAGLACLEKIEIEFDNRSKLVIDSATYATPDYQWLKELVNNMYKTNLTNLCTPIWAPNAELILVSLNVSMRKEPYELFNWRTQTPFCIMGGK